MNDSECQPLPAEAERPLDDAGDRVREVIDRHYDFVWRTLQYLGMSEANAEDGAQQVMCVLARRIAEIEPGAETSFLFSTAVRVAAENRRNARRRPPAFDVVDVEALVAETPSADELVDRQRAREVLGRVLEAIPEDLRIVLVLVEIEELSSPAIAEMIGVPLGTVASRLRRAREAFRAIVARMQAAQRTRGGEL
jgi:RNA polymerase sigma-70 factor (ECF subfamily)